MIYIIIALSILVIVLTYFCFKFAIILVNTQETIEECLDSLDENYKEITEILEIPVFYDSEEVRRVVRIIENTKNSLLYIANKITFFYKEENLEEENNEKNT